MKFKINTKQLSDKDLVKIVGVIKLRVTKFGKGKDLIEIIFTKFQEYVEMD